MSVSDLIYDWNTVSPELQKPDRHIGFDDETLRDGLQSPSVCVPSVEKKIELLHLMNELGIDTADIGLPASTRAHFHSDDDSGGQWDHRSRRSRP